MNIPSIKTIETRLKIDRVVAKEVRRLLEKDCNGTYAYGTLRLVERALGYHLLTHGVESIVSLGKKPAILYLNTGDPYNTTVMNVGGRWVIGAWGDLVEKGGYE